MRFVLHRAYHAAYPPTCGNVPCSVILEKPYVPLILELNIHDSGTPCKREETHLFCIDCAEAIMKTNCNEIEILRS